MARSTRALLWCGGAAAVVYVAANITVPLLDPNYDVTSQTVSELSAIGAPTRTAWIGFCSGYTVLLAAFSVGVLRVAGKVTALRIAGVALALQAVLSAYWPPMHMRGAPFGLTDALHIVWAVLTLLCSLL